MKVSWSSCLGYCLLGYIFGCEFLHFQPLCEELYLRVIHWALGTSPSEYLTSCLCNLRAHSSMDFSLLILLFLQSSCISLYCVCSSWGLCLMADSWMECVPGIARLGKSDESVGDPTAELKEQGNKLKVSSLHTLNLCDRLVLGFFLLGCGIVVVWEATRGWKLQGTAKIQVLFKYY